MEIRTACCKALNHIDMLQLKLNFLLLAQFTQYYFLLNQETSSYNPALYGVSGSQKSKLNCAEFVVWAVCQVAKGEPAQTPICTLNIVLPENFVLNAGPSEPDLLELEKNYSFQKEGISEYQCSDWYQ